MFVILMTFAKQMFFRGLLVTNGGTLVFMIILLLSVQYMRFDNDLNTSTYLFGVLSIQSFIDDRK